MALFQCRECTAQFEHSLEAGCPACGSMEVFRVDPVDDQPPEGGKQSAGIRVALCLVLWIIFIAALGYRFLN